MGYYSDEMSVNIKGKYDKKATLKKIVTYVTHENYRDDKGKKKTGSKVKFSGGYGVRHYEDINAVVEDMTKIQKHYKKESGRRFYHIIVTFRINIPAEKLDKVAKKLCKKYFSEYQSVYGIHESVEHPHIHICLNSVSFCDGKKFQVPYNPYNDIECKKFYIELEKFIIGILYEMQISIL